MTVLAVHTGRVADLPWGSRTVRSAFVKQAVDGPVAVGPLGLAGDEQGDTVKHGGPDKAVCVFASESYAAYEARLGRALDRPAFGENLTTRGLVESAVCLGDVYEVGTALLEVSLPRNPCFKVGARHGTKDFVLWMERSGLTGFYLRVLVPGTLGAGDAVALVDRPQPAATIAEANRVMHHDKADRAGLEALLAIPALGASWRRTFTRRLERDEVEDPTRRRFGVSGSPTSSRARGTSTRRGTWS